MKGIKRTFILFVCFALLLSLASCAQGQVNEERLPGGVPGGAEPGGGPQMPAGDGPQPPADVGPHENEGHNGFYLDEYAEIEDSTFEDTRVGPGQGTLLYTVTSAGLYDSLEDAEISEESYAVSGEDKYDHYVKVDMNIQNVDITDLSHDFSINAFGLQCRLYPLRDAVWFSLGGLEDEDGRGYFHYKLPPTGEAMEISVAWGLADSELADLRDAGGIWLTYGINIWQKMKLEGLI